MTNEKRVYKALTDAGLSIFEFPNRQKPKWYEFKKKKHDKKIFDALEDAGLPRFNYSLIYYQGMEGVQGLSDAGGFMLRLWCQALGLKHRGAWGDYFYDPTTKEGTPMSAHDRMRYAT